MTEATVLADFSKKLKERTGAEVCKHRDSSMVGLPDTSVTWRGHVLWLEAKFYDWEPWMKGQTDFDLGTRLLEKATKAAETQRKKVDSLGRASGSLYIFWIKKSYLVVVDPVRLHCLKLKSTAEAVEAVARLFEAWPFCPMPPLSSL